MSKARITYRFENTRQPAAGQAAAEQASWEVKKEEKTEEKRERSNVIPLRHEHFEIAENPIVVESSTEQEPEPKREKKPELSWSEYPYDYGAWNETSYSEADRVERLIRESESYEKRFAEEDIEEYSPEDGYWRPRTEWKAEGASKHRRRLNERQGPSWWKIAASVVGAVGTGILFGGFVLNMFAGQPPEEGLAGMLQSTQQPGIAETSHGAAAGAAVASEVQQRDAMMASVQLPERRMFLLQNGMFQTLEAARNLAREMESKGLAATVEQGENYYVYAGVTSNREAALRAGRKLQESGVEVYVKPYDLPKVEEILWSSDGSAEALTAFATQGSRLVQMIGDLTLVHLEGSEPVALESSTLQTLRSEHMALADVYAQASAGLPPDAQQMLKQMDAAIRTSVVAIDEYGSHPDFAYLWSAQSALMDYIIAEKQLLMTIAAR